MMRIAKQRDSSVRTTKGDSDNNHVSKSSRGSSRAAFGALGMLCVINLLWMIRFETVHHRRNNNNDKYAKAADHELSPKIARLNEFLATSSSGNVRRQSGANNADGASRIMDIILDNSGSRDLLESVWDLHSRHYGNEINIVGLNDETCSAARSAAEDMARGPSAGVNKQGRQKAREGPFALAGLFSTEPNRLFELFSSNCHFNRTLMEYNDDDTPMTYAKWAVPWGRHKRPWPTEDPRRKQVFPLVVIRDPYSWWQHACHVRRDSKLNFDRNVCPGGLASNNNAAQVFFHDETYSSFLGLWNDYYSQYFNDDKAMLIRYEDLVMQPKMVVQSLCSCVGGEFQEDDFDYQFIKKDPKLLQHQQNHMPQAPLFTTTADNDSGGAGDLEEIADKFSEAAKILQKVWMPYQTSVHRRKTKLTSSDWKVAREQVLSSDLMNAAKYIHQASFTSRGEWILTEEQLEEQGKGKEELIKLLQDANIDITARLLDAMPTWQQVVDLYGPKPILPPDMQQKCSRFNSSYPMIMAVAGTFNSGTNALYKLLEKNCAKLNLNRRKKDWRIRWQVPWGKHDYPSEKGKHFTRDSKHIRDDPERLDRIFPIITIRDPYHWMQSMCRRSYEARWPHNARRCPNLVAISDREKNRVKRWWEEQETNYSKKMDDSLYDNPDTPELTRDVVPLRIRRKNFTSYTWYPSIPDHWMAYYKAYYDMQDPKIMIRVEDLVYHPRAIAGALCQCAMGSDADEQYEDDDFQYSVAQSVKGDPLMHGYPNLLIRYAKAEDKTRKMLMPDWEFATKRLSRSPLMDIFAYKNPPPPKRKS